MSFLALRSPKFNDVLDTGQYLPLLTTNAASGLGATSATGNGSLDNGGVATITEQGFVYSTSANPTTADSKVTVTAPTYGAYSQSITGLTTATLYHYRAYAINSYGTGYGVDTTFTTTGGGAATANLLALLGVG